MIGRVFTYLGATAVVALAAVGGYSTVTAAMQYRNAPEVSMQPSDVKVLKNMGKGFTVEAGFGSAVHIGNGFYLTANHVVDGTHGIKLKTKDTLLRDAEILWQNKPYDIALLKSSAFGVETSPLSCELVPPGTRVRAFGNPRTMEFVFSTGTVAGDPFLQYPWKSVYPVDISIAPGQSGGPLKNDRGEIVGISVGVFTAPSGVMNWSLTGFGAVVPSPVVCELLAR